MEGGVKVGHDTRAVFYLFIFLSESGNTVDVYSINQEITRYFQYQSALLS